MAIKGQKAYLNTLLKNKAKIYTSFIEVTDDVASASLKLDINGDIADGKLRISISSRKAFKETLNTKAEEIAKTTDGIIKSDLFTSVETIKDPIDDQMIKDMAQYLSREVLTDVTLNATKQVNATQFKKIYKNAAGKTTSYLGSLSGISKKYKKDIDALIEQAMVIGRDNVELAKDISEYAKGGKKALLGRSPKYANAKISKNVDWKALRISRTTIQGGVQDASIVGYETSPSVRGFNWVLSPLHKQYSICEDIVASNAHTYETFAYTTAPHPNCLSHAEPNNLPRKKFLSDLKRWDGGDNVPYLDDWNKKYYEPAEEGKVVKFDKLLANNIEAAKKQ